MTAKELLYKIGNVPEYKPLKEYFLNLEAELTDIRKIQDRTAEGLKAHELASTIIMEKIIKPMSQVTKQAEVDNYN